MLIPKPYDYLNLETGPRLLKTALQLFGTIETPGPGNNPSIMTWAKKTGLAKQYHDDATAWCGLFMTYVSLQSGWDDHIPTSPLLARNWQTFGKAVKTPMLGDVLVFWRESINGYKGHVGIYVGENADNYFVLGGNQGDKVSIAPKPKNRLLCARRCIWRINQPANVRRIFVKTAAATSAKEA